MDTEHAIRTLDDVAAAFAGRRGYYDRHPGPTCTVTYRTKFEPWMTSLDDAVWSTAHDSGWNVQDPDGYWWPHRWRPS